MAAQKPNIVTISFVGSAVLIASAMICLYMGEIFLALTRPPTKSEALMAMRQGDVASFPAVTPQVILLRNHMRGFGDGSRELVPLGGVAHAQTVFCREDGEMITYRSDRYGFRNDDSFWDQPVDIVAIGDSFTQGACVDEATHFVGQMRERFGNVLNLGSFGNGPHANLAVLGEYGVHVKPKWILWFYVANDMAIDMQLEKGNRVLSQYIRPGFTQQLRHRQQEIDTTLAPFLQREWQRQKNDEERASPSILTLGHIRQAIRVKTRAWLRPPAPHLPAEFDYDRQQTIDYQKHALLVATAAQTARAHGSKFVFVIVPDARMLRTTGPLDQLPSKHVTKLKHTIASMDIPVVDLYADVKELKNPEHLYTALDGYYGHFHAEGYRTVGRFLIDHLDLLIGETHAGP